MFTVTPSNKSLVFMFASATKRIVKHITKSIHTTLAGTLCAMLFAGAVVAEENQSLLLYAAIHESLERANPQIKAESITPTSIDGIMRVQINNGDTLYMAVDGGHFFTGSLYRNEAGKDLVNVTENDQKQVRVALLNEEAAKQVWVFPATQPKKASIAVFTDVDCYYCQKLHADMKEINALGIEVRYLAFPRAGLGSSSHQVLVDAWCAENPNEFMTEAKLRSHNKMPPQASPAACENPVEGHYALSQKMSLQGTPSILLADGTLWPGYIPAATLAQRLNIR